MTYPDLQSLEVIARGPAFAGAFAGDYSRPDRPLRQRVADLVRGVPAGTPHAVVAYEMGGAVPLLVLSQAPEASGLAEQIVIDAPEQHFARHLAHCSPGLNACQLGLI